MYEPAMEAGTPRVGWAAGMLAIPWIVMELSFVYAAEDVLRVTACQVSRMETERMRMA